VLRKNTDKEGFASLVESIKEENARRIQELKEKSKDSVSDIIFAHQKESYEIELQVLKAVKDELSERTNALEE
jgi:hypothetical protein